MLSALLSGQALTATELSGVAEVTKQTASAHLARLVEAQLLAVERQGRHRYFRLAHDDVAHLLESLLGVAYRSGAVRLRSSPRDPALRKARVCYDHLAGELAVLAYDALERRGFFVHDSKGMALSPAGTEFCERLGVAIAEGRRPACRPCLDWSVRRHHLAGRAGAALLEHCYSAGWASRREHTRIVDFTRAGEEKFRRLFAP
jgi:hypothetical protein